MPLSFFKIYRLAPFLLSSALISHISHADSLSTIFTGGNSQNGNMFDISVTGTSSINITGFAQNFSGTSATISGFELWTIAGGITGNTANASAWTLISSTGSFTSNTQGTPTNIPFSTSISISLNPGQTIGIYLTNQSGRTLNSYTDGTAVGNVAATNSNLTIYEGYGVAYPFGQLFSPRIWNGTIFYSAGPAAADTQSSMQYQSRQLRSAFNTQTVAANFALNYDCNVFDVKGMCISAGGRYTTIDNPNINNSAAVVTLGYKVNPNIRIGAYLDQNINISNPTGINISNNTPLMGLYAVWNKEQSGLGYQVRLANTYQDKDVTQTRTVFNTSEAGSGKSSLQSQSYLAELSYAFQYEDRTLVRPYFGLRYTHLKQKGYTEDTTDTVTDPLTVAALRDKGTTALLGLKINRSLTDKATLTAQLGFEQDLHHKVDQYSATDLNGSELTAIAFNSNIKRTRPVASIGAFYDVTKTQRASATINYQQTPFHSTGSTTAYFNYMIGF
ncbi:Autotransporter beta-domain containing protein [Candidatus Methylopumilus planktonicus]